MRIVAGKYRHRLIEYPNDVLHIRPTKDRIREALFSALGDLTNLDVLDLYAGSGAMGIEALSRNANKCVFVDNNKVAINTIKTNIRNLDIHNYELIFDSDINALEKFKNEKYAFDLVILDPPYKSDTYQNVIEYLLSHNLCNANARIITECDHDLDFSFFNIKKKKEYRYGEIKVNVLYL
ncbi:MAG: 16S rRNA (guanine(966)-N(2))-methyltransferase RsmD [Bacilli bacterium]|nr:16S rRNA (guanine(966)-N(2))-methyltransferase RsmD [Bacilli bacterium]